MATPLYRNMEKVWQVELYASCVPPVAADTSTINTSHRALSRSGGWMERVSLSLCWRFQICKARQRRQGVRTQTWLYIAGIKQGFTTRRIRAPFSVTMYIKVLSFITGKTRSLPSQRRRQNKVDSFHLQSRRLLPSIYFKVSFCFDVAEWMNAWAHYCLGLYSGLFVLSRPL